MLLQPPREAYPNPQPFFPSHFHYQNYVQPYFVNLSRIQTYICDPFYYAFPNHHLPTYYFQSNPALNPRVLPKPRRNTNIRPKRTAVATTYTYGVRKWMPKKRSSNFQGSSVIISFPKNPHRQKTSTTTTLMIKNVPNQFGRSDLLDILKDHCLDKNLKAVLGSEPSQKSEFDFLYLPMDFKQYWENKRISNLGYAFVNFTSAVAALRFYKQYHNFEWPVQRNKKICEVTCAKTQGKAALKKRFMNKVFWCHSNEYLPVILSPPCDGAVNSSLVTVGKLAGEPKIE
ncbi:hypothetical protein M0R45_011236 [Rubus argutus]|uniref:Mei2-like C-terminal RNA recognition motif domain-containing protein n=1 Tax=Rubus argutus TaxID=59490 RepID=A0AAW1YD33_RUBAR